MNQLSRKIWQAILGFTLFRIALAFFLPLTPQEAYYWSWSQDLALSYFDHPPLASYSIWLTTQLFGQTIFGIKIAAVLWYLGFYWVVARLVQEMFQDERITFWSIIALNATLAFELYGFVITPDTPLVFAWSATIYAIWKLTESGESKWWYVAGFFMGLAWLGKYSGIMLVPSILLFLLLSRNQRKWLGTPHPYLGVLLSLLVFSPVLIWNSQNDWVSFAFQGSRRTAGMGNWEPRFFGELFGSQLFILTPYIFILLIGSLGHYVKRASSMQDDKKLLLLSSGLVTILFFTAISFRSLVKMNWLVPAYWSVIILAIVRVWENPTRIKRFKIGLLSSYIWLFLGVSTVAIPNVPLGEGNTWSGWREAANQVSDLADSLKVEQQEYFIFSTNYKASSLLKFYLPDHPRTYAQGIINKPALQFDIWKREKNLRGRLGILVVDDRREYRFKEKSILPYFSQVKKYRSIRINNFGQPVRKIDIYLCRDYKGLQIEE